jgi:hypothetical protein
MVGPLSLATRIFHAPMNPSTGKTCIPVSEREVAEAAARLGYDLWRIPGGHYLLERDQAGILREIIEVSTLANVVDLLKQ